MPKALPKAFRDDFVAIAMRRDTNTTLRQIATDFGISCRAPGSLVMAVWSGVRLSGDVVPHGSVDRAVECGPVTLDFDRLGCLVGIEV